MVQVHQHGIITHGVQDGEEFKWIIGIIIDPDMVQVIHGGIVIIQFIIDPVIHTITVVIHTGPGISMKLK